MILAAEKTIKQHNYFRIVPSLMSRLARSATLRLIVVSADISILLLISRLILKGPHNLSEIREPLWFLTGPIPLLVKFVGVVGSEDEAVFPVSILIGVFETEVAKRTPPRVGDGIDDSVGIVPDNDNGGGGPMVGDAFVRIFEVTDSAWDIVETGVKLGIVDFIRSCDGWGKMNIIIIIYFYTFKKIKFYAYDNLAFVRSINNYWPRTKLIFTSLIW